MRAFTVLVCIKWTWCLVAAYAPC